MIYQVRANIFFTALTDAEDLASKCITSLSDAVVVHPDESNQEGCRVEVIKCFHDETPTKPCEYHACVECPQNTRSIDKP
ncbi:hypothetical protein ES703_42142 [subsurface metagenome]